MRFEAMLNGCKCPGKVYSALSALAAHEQDAALTVDNHRIVDAEIRRLLDMMENPATVERINHYCKRNGLPLPPVEVSLHE